MVFKIIPAMIAAKKITPKKSFTPSRQLRMIQPTFRATARATSEQPNTTKKAIVPRRLVIFATARPIGDCTAKPRKWAGSKVADVAMADGTEQKKEPAKWTALSW